MKRKTIKKLCLSLTLLMISFFSLGLKSTLATAETTEPTMEIVYPFEKGINAFRYAWELTVPPSEEIAGNHVDILYKHNEATDEAPGFPLDLSTNGYLALNIKTDNAVDMSFKLTQIGADSTGFDENGNPTVHTFKGSAYFLNEDESLNNNVTVTANGIVSLPQNACGALILELAGFPEANLSEGQIAVFSAHVEKTETATITFGSLGYYADSTAEFNSLSAANQLSAWKIFSNTEGAPLTQVQPITAPYPFRTVYDRFTNGKLWTVEEEVADWAKAYYHFDAGTEALDQTNGYFALQIEAVTDVAVYPTIWDNATEVEFSGTPYFVCEDGLVRSLEVNVAKHRHIEIPAGRKGMLVLPLSGFVSQTFNFNNVVYFMANLHGYYYGAQTARLGELGYYTGRVDGSFRKLTSLSVVGEGVKKIEPNGNSSLQTISSSESDFRTGDNAFRYGAVWSGVQQTQTEAWAQFLVGFDSGATDFNEKTGILAMQIEIICNGNLLFLPSLWDGPELDGQSYLAREATFISEDGSITKYGVFDDASDKYRYYLSMPSCKGVLVMNLADFEDKTDWTAVNSALITVNTTNAYDFTLKLGEVAYYEEPNATMQKLVSLDKITDFDQFNAFDNYEPADVYGQLDRIPNKEISPTIRYASASTVGDIGLIYYVELPNEANEVVYGTFTIKDGAGNVVGDPAIVEGVYRKKQGCFAFVASVLPKDYKNSVVLTVGEKTVYTSSVFAYATQLSQVANQKQAAMGTALLDYCEAARVFFSGETAEDKNVLTEEEMQDLAKYASVTTKLDGVVELNFGSLDIESRTAINVYFTTTNSIETITVKNNGTGKIIVYTADVDWNEDGLPDENVYRASIVNIVAKDLNETYTITIGEDTIVYSALSYAYQAVSGEDSSIELYNLAAALYRYSVVADAYFGA